MKKLRRLILLWILVMAIPLQGLAAASMMLCASEHHQVVNQVSSTSTSHHDQLSDENSHCADMKTAAHQHASKDKCSSCTACCVGAAMLASYLGASVSRPASEKIDMVFSSQLGHISDGLERPPRA